MSEFEIATFASQEATLAYQQAALQISRTSVTAIYVQAAVTAAGILIHGFLIAWGLRLMRRSADHRDDQHKETMAALGDQHKETLAALNDQHKETLAALDDQHKATMTALELERRALETLIERTAPPES